MDRVRLGRALGKGARLAARTAMEAVDAASAPSPEPAAPPRRVTVEPPPRRAAASSPQRASKPGSPFSTAPLRPALNAARAGVTAPLRRASKELWHELTGSFFALFAFSFSVGLWHARGNAFSGVAADRHRFYAFCALTLLFAYFAISSFLRARRVSR